MRTRLRHVAQVNPTSRRFDSLEDDALVPFLPMERVWPGDRLDLSETRPKSAVASGYTRFESGDVLVPKITPTFEAGRSVLVPDLPKAVGVGTTELHVVRAGDAIDRRYLLYQFLTYSFLKIGESEMYGVAGQKRVPDDLLRDWDVDLPPLDEQRRIANFLDSETERIDRLREATALQIDLLKVRRTEEYRSATTGSYLVRDRVTGVSWMPRMAAEWELFKVGRCFRTGSGTTPRSSDSTYFDGQHHWINTGDLRDGVVDHPAKRVSDAALRDYPTLRVYPPGALIVAMYGATTGRVGVNAVPACVNQACCVLTPSESLDVEYAFYWFLAHRSEILGLASGGGQPNISQDLIRMLRIPAPPTRREQVMVAETCRSTAIDSADQQAQLAAREKLLAERRQALITAAVTGQIDVTTARGVDE